MTRMFKFTGIAEEITWKPTDIGGCKLWLRSDLAWQDAAKTVPCVNDSLIWTGEDKSGNGEDFVQATEPLYRPPYKTNQINGYPAWLLGQTGPGLSCFLGNAAITLNQPLDMYFVMKQVNWAFGKDFIHGGGDALRVCQLMATPGLALYSGGGWACENPGLVTGSFGLFQARFNGASSLTRVNGGSPIAGNPGAGNATMLWLGAYAFGGVGADIILVEFIIYDSPLSDPNRQRLELYFNTEAQGNGYALY